MYIYIPMVFFYIHIYVCVCFSACVSLWPYFHSYNSLKKIMVSCYEYVTRIVAHTESLCVQDFFFQFMKK